MKLINFKSIVRTLVAGVAVALVSSSVQAGSVTVFEDDGGGTGTVQGSISTTNTLTSNGFLSTYNEGTGNFPVATISYTTTTSLNDIGGVLSGSGEKVLHYGNNSVTMDFTVLYEASGHLSNVTAPTITVIGGITSVTGTSGLVLGGYDFSPFQNAGSTLSITWTKSTIGFDWNSILNHNLSQLGVGSGLQQDAAVPEPTSVAMLGLGLCGLISFRRFRRKSA